MRTIKTTVYTFAELSEQGKDNAVERLSNINTSYDWYEFTYDDAKNVGMSIGWFDLDRGRLIDLEIDSHIETANKIIKEHGETCDTHKNAKQFIAERDALVSKYSNGGNKVPEENENDFDCELDELESEYKKSLEEDYLSLLRNEYEYLSSREAITETIEANDYEFTEDGKLI
jgi:hypothetical protein